MNQRFLMWGLASIAFVVTLTVTSWNEGLWQSDETAAPVHNVRAASLTSANPTDLPFRPFVTTHVEQPAPVETVAAVKPLPPPPDLAPAPQEEPPPADEPSTQASAQELDDQEFQAHRDRAAEHSARSR
jgi:hypothetical protein